MNQEYSISLRLSSQIIAMKKIYFEVADFYGKGFDLSEEK